MNPEKAQEVSAKGSGIDWQTFYPEHFELLENLLFLIQTSSVCIIFTGTLATD